MSEFVKDEFGNSYPLGKLCGSGGQGSTYLLQDNSRLLVKIVKKKYEDLIFRIREIQYLNIDDKIHIAKPLLPLAVPNSGYLMMFMEGMESIKDLLIKNSNENIFDFFERTSSLKRRYKLLRKLCEILCYFDEHDIVYCDLSPNNIFVSKDKQDFEVWLIDGDNLHKSNYKVYGHNLSIGTTQYWAPEVADGNPNTIQSDEFSFAVIVFKMLTLIGPFDGDSLLNDTNECGWDNTSSENDEINYFDCPWVGNKKDNKNRQISGIPYGFGLTDDLYELCRRNFEEGLRNPRKRPNIHEWLMALLKAENNCLKLSIFNSLTSTEFPYHYLKDNAAETKKELSLDSTRIYLMNCKTIEYFYIDGVENENVLNVHQVSTYSFDRNNHMVCLTLNDVCDIYNSNSDERIIEIIDQKKSFMTNVLVSETSDSKYKISANQPDKFISNLEDLEIVVVHKNDDLKIWKKIYTFKKVNLGN